jgi:exo-beta-1,3-glucanase (GH17 family)
VGRLIALAGRYPDIVFSVAVGNEATVDWTDHFVPVPRMIEHVRRVKAAVRQPVTFCENYVPWQHKLRDLVDELDFISLHTYPVWEYKHIHEALDYTKDNVASVARLYPASPSSSPKPAGAPTATAAACTPNTRCRNCRPSTTRT